MTEQEYNTKNKQLKQVRNKIANLQIEEKNLRRKIVEYKFQDIKNKYFYDEEDSTLIKPLGLVREQVVCMLSYPEVDIYRENKNYYFIQDVYDLDDFSTIKEITQEMFAKILEQRETEIQKMFQLI